LYDLYICGPNGSCWRFAGEVPSGPVAVAVPELRLRSLPERHELVLEAWNAGVEAYDITTRPQAYYSDPAVTLTLRPDEAAQTLAWNIAAAGFWYDVAITSSNDSRWLRRFAGRMETG
jgi:phospholipase C